MPDDPTNRAAETGPPEAAARVLGLPAPCDERCPTGEPVRDWVLALRGGRPALESAWESIIATNPLPSVLGRICYAPCEERCCRTRLDRPVSIRSLERLVGDHALAQGWSLPRIAPRLNKRIVVVGAGPCGLSAAYHLARSGHDVVLREAHTAAGGLLRRGITEARLPKVVLDAEIRRILALGVLLETRRPVRRVKDAFADADGVIWAAGASVCMALAENKTIWKQPVHSNSEGVRTATVSVGHGMRAADALAAHLAGTAGPVCAEAHPSREPGPAHPGTLPDSAFEDAGGAIAPEASRCLSCRARGSR